MASFRQQTANFEQILTGLLKESVSDRAIKAYGKAVIDIIVKRTRRGDGLIRKDRGPSTLDKFDSLSSSYIKFRTRYQNKLDSSTSIRKSNLTFSGQLLRSLVVAKTSDGFSIRPSKRNRQKIVPSENSKTNEQVAGFLEKQGRVFLGLTVGELRQVRNLYETGLAAAIKRQL